MKTPILFLLIIGAGQAIAGKLIIPTIGGGYKIVDETVSTYPAAKSEPVEYEWIKVKKTKAKLEAEIYRRKLDIQENQRIAQMNRAGLWKFDNGKWRRYYLPLKKIKPLSKWKWIKVVKGEPIQQNQIE